MQVVCRDPDVVTTSTRPVTHSNSRLLAAGAIPNVQGCINLQLLPLGSDVGHVDSHLHPGLLLVTQMVSTASVSRSDHHKWKGKPHP